MTELSRGAACAGLPAHAGLGRAAVVRCRGAVLPASRRAGRGARAPPQRAAPGALSLPHLPQSYCPAVPASCEAGSGAGYAAESAALGTHMLGVPRQAPAKPAIFLSGCLHLCEMHTAPAHHIRSVAPQASALLSRLSACASGRVAHACHPILSKSTFITERKSSTCFKRGRQCLHVITPQMHNWSL